MSYRVYWIRTSDHSNPKTEGYIGITSREVDFRLKEHSYSTLNPHLRNALFTYDTEIEVLAEGLTKDQALKMEYDLRPEPEIGWNIVPGGGLPPRHKGKSLGGKNKLKGADRTPKQMEAAERHSKRMQNRTPWNKGKPGKPMSEEHKRIVSETFRGKPHKIVSCPKCGKSGGISTMKRWHFDRCKNKQGNDD